jgi:ABC transporter related protein
VGYLGANRAGKSTTIKILTGILVPTSGVVEVAGRVPWAERQSNAARIGVVFGQRSQLLYDLPLRDSFELVRDLYGVCEIDYVRRLEMFIELLQLNDFLDTPVRYLSLGQRMRGDLAAALLHQPDVVYLDEPTVGLDVVAKRRIRGFIAEMNATLGTTVILTTHDMDDVEALCRRIIMIDKGSILFDGCLEELKYRYVRERAVHVTPAEGVDAASIRVAGTTASVEDGVAVLRFDPKHLSTPEVIGAVTASCEIADLAVTESSLSDVVATLYAETDMR